ncbi:sugar ABC transporter ATP-binding protein [Streptomyces sp. NPDC056470]|uniref:sugar ABC transporter ATP-binding protein n=1 Tax=Streptomyces sp. NPDC056470 TaxID=3345831 RepID=UPI003680C3AD
MDLDLAPGEVQGLVGQNGSGKSTLIKILSGYHAPDAGCRLEICGREVRLPLHPSDLPRHGLAFVHQELGLVRDASVLENLFIASFPTRFPGRIDRRGERVRAARALERVGLDVPVDRSVGSLAAVERAMLAIARAMHQLETVEEGALILDEPTAYLPRDGVERLFHVVREVADAGLSVLFVGHDLTEIREITDSVTVLRDGRRVGCAATGRLTHDDLVELVLGFRLEEFYPEQRHSVSEEVLSVRDLAAAGCRGISFEARRGEIVGITGLAGSGYETIPYALFGAMPATGYVRIGDEGSDVGRLTPSTAMRRGMGLVPGQRLTFGGVPAATVAENLTLVTLDRVCGRFGRIRHGFERERAGEVMGQFGVRPARPLQTFATFSGGNQQKIVLAKWLDAASDVLLLHEPTQGVDVGARRDILGRLREVAARGRAVVVASSEYEDLAQICDRVLVLRNGRIAAELGGESVTHERLLKQCFAESDETTETGGG